MFVECIVFFLYFHVGGANYTYFVSNIQLFW